MNIDFKSQITKLKKEKNFLILAHYYVSDEIQELADFVGDSYYLSKLCMDRPEEKILFCGVSFMGESAKILSPEKSIHLPDLDSRCPMADMSSVDEILEARKKIPDLAVVTYINSTSEVKQYSDVCVTSSNALRVISKLKEKNIFFIPDKNLGYHLSTLIKNKNFHFNRGFCPVHNYMCGDDVLKAKEQFPQSKVVSHPECPKDVLCLSDFIGSTSEIIDFCTNSSSTDFIVCTEIGVFYELKLKNPSKNFYSINDMQICPNMKRITLEKVYNTLLLENNEVILSPSIINESKRALTLMHTLA